MFHVATIVNRAVVTMPGANRGKEICQNVRMDPGLKDVKILMMTARGSAMERRKGLALGADGFIAKPFELKELRDEVRRLLEPGTGPAA